VTIDRNSPCPCGSGRKYKRCCLRRDADAARALHLIGAEAGELPFGAQFPAGDIWQADLVPIGATFDDDHGARPVVALVCGNGFVLNADILACGPSEPADVAAAIATAVEQARASSLDAPRVIEVRFDSVGRALAALVGRTLEVRVLPRLDGVDDAAFNLQKNVIGEDRDPRLRASCPATWKGWMLGEDRVRRLFAASAAYHRAAPWKYASDDATIAATVPGGGTWYLAILGSAGETYGVAAYAALADVQRLFDKADRGERDTFLDLSGAVMALTFGPSSKMPRPMRQEIRAARWDVVGDFAFPLLMMLNTPAGGITPRQADDLIAILRDVPSFVESEPGGSPPRSASGEGRTRFTWVLLGDDEDTLIWSPPLVLAPATCRGLGANPSAIISRENRADAFRADESVLNRFIDWLARPVGGKAPAVSTIKRHMRPARALAEFMTHVHGARLCAVSELDLRIFLYDAALSRGLFGDFALGQARGSLRRFFAFLDECERIECPWAAPILDDADAFEFRRATFGDARLLGKEDDWRHELTADLVARVLLPSSATEDGVSWGPTFTLVTAALYRELMRRWLVWRDEVIASGNRNPSAVAEAALRKQVEWQATVHPSFGVSPAAALRR
jgi:hypothetical protein